MSSRLQFKTHRAKNPFYLPPAAELFGLSEEHALRKQEEKEKLQSLTLTQRVELLQTPVPPCRTQRTKVRAVSRETEKNEPKKAKTARGKRTTDFITEKREIYLTQLLIDKKTKEINKIRKTISDNDKKLNEDDESMTIMSNKIKRATQQTELTLSRGRKEAEVATQQRVELTKQHRFQLNRVNILRSEILKNQDTVELYQDYNQFMNSIIPQGHKQEEFFNDYDLIKQQFEKIEKDNLFVQMQCQRVEDIDSRGASNVAKQIKERESILEQFSQAIENVPAITSDDYTLKNGTVSASQDAANEMAEIARLIHATYHRCFVEEADQSPIYMLTKLENSLNEMYDDINFVEESFVAKKTAATNAIRRNEARRAAQTEKDRLLAEKKDQALQRATRPTKKRVGRPIMVRTVPVRKGKRDDAKEKELIRKRQELDNLLFGPAYD